MSKLTSVFRGKSRGIGLIETMIAILLLGIVAVAFLGGISTASIAILISDERSTAQSLALSQMESVKSLPYEEGASPSYFPPTTKLTPVNCPPIPFFLFTAS